ncbi:hypothetical protein P3342_011729 [Pyrenophora teres f. teres]|uniref:Uncharacterized protein n=1 Tax=Pyrenophora teres f. teres TaxID=97479 RepID=A0A6S6WBV1_9PLEO|nr:hypothetical protein HRS9139_10407 [Pyrenophora teres f. teres]KAE8822517.1 hypothetical protein PTNB85_10403 [Pyrenophora teres f. teres]KAE8825924.1 hypothetical protein HRS9122_10109 [Pyrenophora teres f. teres]KAE8858656.1 hypothetical protein PTNB29_07871 [Pyrenophora teres f. teres]KAE8861501.1 hypothetical protein PTNB73_07055 [Pyrenophora teres f. teres]
MHFQPLLVLFAAAGACYAAELRECRTKDATGTCRGNTCIWATSLPCEEGFSFNTQDRDQNPKVACKVNEDCITGYTCCRRVSI